MAAVIWLAHGQVGARHGRGRAGRAARRGVFGGGRARGCPVGAAWVPLRRGSAASRPAGYQPVPLAHQAWHDRWMKAQMSEPISLR
jgi:hypothetical protein